jgi:SAM-dependent methyltransferase
MAQVIEHVADPVIFLKGVERVLKPGGVAVLSTPNSNGWGASIFGKKWINWHTPYHIQHFSHNSLKIVCETVGLKIEKCVTVTSSEWLYYQWLHIAYYPAESEPSAFWIPSKKTNGYPKRRKVEMFINLMHKLKINHFITRTFDLLHVGDNFVYVLRKPS